jgi:putative peptide zinc metalloprotease protein
MRSSVNNLAEIELAQDLREGSAGEDRDATVSHVRNRVEGIIVDSSEGEPTYLMVCQGRRYIRLSHNAYHLLNSVNEGLSFQAIANKLGQQQGRAISSDEVETAYNHVAQKVEAIERKPADLSRGFWVRFRIIPESLVDKIARRMSFAFKPVPVCLLMALILTAALLSFQEQLFANFSQYVNHPAYFWEGYGLFLISLVFHEFGHASACAHYGAKPSEIGFTFYVIYPALYSDVSAAWQLKRGQRVVVDLGGVFFQIAVGSVYVVLYSLYGWSSLRVAALMVLANCLFSLNPILKFDGYWVVADSLGVTNLYQQPRRILRYFLARARGEKVKPLPWGPAISLIMVGYAILSFAFWARLIVAIIPYFWRSLHHYPVQVGAFLNSIESHTWVLDSPQFHSLLASTYRLFILVFMAAYPVRFLYGRARLVIWRLAKVAMSYHHTV